MNVSCLEWWTLVTRSILVILFQLCSTRVISFKPQEGKSMSCRRPQQHWALKLDLQQSCNLSQPSPFAEHNNKRQAATHFHSVISTGTWCWFQRSPSPAGWSWSQLPPFPFSPFSRISSGGGWAGSSVAVTSLWRTQRCADETQRKHRSTALLSHSYLVLSLTISPITIPLLLPLSSLSQHLSVPPKLWQAVGGNTSCL